MKVDFWAQDWAKAADTVRGQFPENMAQTLALADEICGNSFTFRGHWEMERTHEPVHFEGQIQWDASPDGDPEWIYAFNRHSFFVTLGKAWRFTGSERYPAAFARLIEDWIDRVPLTEQSKATTWRGIETGLRCENWLRALSLFAGSGVPDARLDKKIENSLRRHAEWLLEAHGPFQQMSNWGVLQDHGLFLLGLALGEPHWSVVAAERLALELHHQVMADGTHWEQSPLYHCEVLHCCLDTMLAAKNARVDLPAAVSDQTFAMAQALAFMVRPDGKLLCQGDSDEVDARDLLALAGRLFCHPLFWGYAGGRLWEENIWDLEGVDLKLPPVSHSGGSVALPHSGNYMLWGGTGEEVDFLHFHCGSLGGGHGHADLLHVDFVSRGETILADSGRYTYVDGPLRRALKSPAAHNTIRVDDLDFSVPESSWGYSRMAEPLKGTYRFTPEADYVEGAHLGYFGCGVLPRRRVLRLGGGLWVVWDSLLAAAGQPHRYEHFYHFGVDGEVEQTTGGGFVYNGRKASAMLAFCGNNLEYSLKKEPMSREYNLLERSDCLCVCHTAEGFATVAAVFAAGPAGGPPQLAAKLVPVHLRSAGFVLPDEKAQALQICMDGQEWTVIICHGEAVSGVDMLAVDGKFGYGRVLVFAPGKETPACLAW